MNKISLPPFEQKPDVQILVLPADRWVGKARYVAKTLLKQKSERARNHYWRQTVHRLVSKLEDTGFDKQTVNNQVSMFFAAVQRELDINAGMRSSSNATQPGDGAA